MDYYAHSKEGYGKKEWQRLKVHLEAAAYMSGLFADRFNAKDYGYTAGLFHDIGKYASEFQRRLEGDRAKVDHSTAGAQEISKLFGKAIARMLAYVVAGHHSGIPDFGSMANDSSLIARLSKTNLPDHSAYQKEIIYIPKLGGTALPIEPIPSLPGFSLSFFIRMLYSCLVDADFLDTEQFMERSLSEKRIGYPNLDEMLKKLEKALEKKCADAIPSPINRYRAEILASCRKKALNKPGMYTLTVPTGGGKTLSSLAFALRHAIEHGMDRVIYVIPYTSIIEQNAAVFRDILGSNCVLEHHSNFQHPEEGSEDWTVETEKIRLSAENWNAPVIVTTNVQFFESLFHNRSSKCRKLHNIARSVIILDEAQMLPTSYLKPCLAAMYELAANYGSSIVLCTATQPALADLLPVNKKLIEITPDPVSLYEAFRRVTVTNLGDIDDQQLSERLLDQDQVLCIVNTRRHAREIFEKIRQRDGTYHLSASMCPAHRMDKLKKIREALGNGELCRVVSTQLIEAGVDVDFPEVYRAAAGIDSIAQAAGRCNREGKRTRGLVYIFRPEKHGLPGGWFRRTAEIAEMVMRHYEDPLSLPAVEQYFTYLYGIEDSALDEKNILKNLEMGAKNLSFPFQKIAEDFQLIEQDSYSIIISWSGCDDWEERRQSFMDQVLWSPFPASLSRKFQPYTVQVYPYEFLELSNAGAITTVAGMFHFLTDSTYYSEETGLSFGDSTNVLKDVLLY